MKVREHNLRILSRIKNGLCLDVINRYKDMGIKIETDGEKFACAEIKECENALEILNLFNKNKADGADVLFSKRFDVEIENEEEEEIYENQLFEPKFQAVRFCVSKITFFVEKSEMYSVDIDYDFERSISITIGKFLSEKKM